MAMTTDTPTATLSEIVVYPIKSLAGVSISTTEVQPRGLAHDRRWMVVNAAGARQSQREHPIMACATVHLESGALRVAAPGLQLLRLPFPGADDGHMTVMIGRTTFSAPKVSRECDAWFSQLLGEPAHLVHMDEATRRPVNPAYALNHDEVSYADGYPFMLVGEESLADLNARMIEALPMNRFRPNLIIRGAGPFAEDGWKRIRIGRAEFAIVKPCDRCVLTTIDQEQGVRRGPEPLRTLARYRQVDQDVYFGQYMLLTGVVCDISVGDGVLVQ